jgi:hypothetical protein
MDKDLHDQLLYVFTRIETKHRNEIFENFAGLLIKKYIPFLLKKELSTFSLGDLKRKLIETDILYSYIKNKYKRRRINYTKSNMSSKEFKETLVSIGFPGIYILVDKSGNIQHRKIKNYDDVVDVKDHIDHRGLLIYNETMENGTQIFYKNEGEPFYQYILFDDAV